MKQLLYFTLLIIITLAGKAQIGNRPLSIRFSADSIAKGFPDKVFFLENQSTNQQTKGEIPFYLDGDEYPNYIGKLSDSLNKFIANNFNYPDSSRKAGIEGTVYISFCVEEKGKITEAKIVKGLSPDIDKEVLRVFSILPNWVLSKEIPKNSKKIKLCQPVKLSLED